MTTVIIKKATFALVFMDVEEDLKCKGIDQIKEISDYALILNIKSFETYICNRQTVRLALKENTSFWQNTIQHSCHRGRYTDYSTFPTSRHQF